MFEFYEFNSANVLIVLTGTFIIYFILSKIFDSSNSNDDSQKDLINIEFLIVSFILSIFLSIIIAYFITAKDEQLLDENYWEN